MWSPKTDTHFSVRSIVTVAFGKETSANGGCIHAKYKHGMLEVSQQGTNGSAAGNSSPHAHLVRTPELVVWDHHYLAHHSSSPHTERGLLRQVFLDRRVGCLAQSVTKRAWAFGYVNRCPNAGFPHHFRKADPQKAPQKSY